MPQEYKGIVAFDIEIATTVPERGDWHALRPLGITCAATAVQLSLDNSSVLPWIPGDPGDLTEILDDVPYDARMSPFNCRVLADYLLMCQSDGLLVVSWNGLGFDFQVLLEECGPDYPRRRELAQLALDHVDPAFAFLCGKGFMVGLAATSKGMGLPGKTEGMSGALAPAMWREGREAQDKVVEYVKQDAQATLDLYNAITEDRKLTWVTRQGRYSNWSPRFQSYTIGANAHRRLLTCTESLKLPMPDTSWMANNSMWARERFHGWATDILAGNDGTPQPKDEIDDEGREPIMPGDYHYFNEGAEPQPEADILDAVADVDTAVLAGAGEPTHPALELQEATVHEAPVSAFATYMPYDNYIKDLRIAAEAFEACRQSPRDETKALALRKAMVQTQSALASLEAVTLHLFWTYGETRPHENVMVCLDEGGSLTVAVAPPAHILAMIGPGDTETE